MLGLGWIAATYTGAYAINAEFAGLAPISFYTNLEAKEIAPETALLDENITGDFLPKFAGTSLIYRKSIVFCLTAAQLKTLHYIYMCKESDITLFLATSATTLTLQHKRDIINILENDSLVDLYEVEIIFNYSSNLKANYFTQ